MHSFPRSIALGLLVVVPAVSIQAQSEPTGVHFGAALNGAMINWEDAETDDGPGISVYGAYNFMSNFSAVLGATGASIKTKDSDKYRLLNVDVGARYTFWTSTPFAPYIEGSYTKLNANGDLGESKLVYSGSGYTGTLGAHYFVFSPRLGLDASFRYTRGDFDKVKFNGETLLTGDRKVSVSRFNIGFAYYL